MEFLGWSESLNSEAMFSEALGAFRSYQDPEPEPPPGFSDDHWRVLNSTAELEHELGLLPHNDRDVENACTIWHCEVKRLPKPPGGNGGGSPIFTPDEMRKMRPPEFRPDYKLIERK